MMDEGIQEEDGVTRQNGVYLEPNRKSKWGGNHPLGSRRYNKRGTIYQQHNATDHLYTSVVNVLKVSKETESFYR